MANSSDIRKAAILVASLDRQAADALIDQLPPPDARRVLQAVVSLGDIDPDEQATVIDEFFRMQRPAAAKASTASIASISGIELSDDLLRRFAPAPQSRPSAGRPTLPVEPDEPPFSFLESTRTSDLAAILAREQPQTIAVVISHMAPQRAAEILEVLPAALQAEVIGRLIDLDDTDPAVIREIEASLASWLSQQSRRQDRRSAGMSAVAEILAAGGTRFEQQVRLNLARHDGQLAQAVNGPAPTFRDLEHLDSDDWSVLLAAAEPEVALLALTGADPELIERMARRLSPADAEQLRRGLEHLGPTRLSDIEVAQQTLATIAQELIIRGQIGRRPRSQLSAMA